MMSQEFIKRLNAKYKMVQSAMGVKNSDNFGSRHIMNLCLNQLSRA